VNQTRHTSRCSRVKRYASPFAQCKFVDFQTANHGVERLLHRESDDSDNRFAQKYPPHRYKHTAGTARRWSRARSQNGDGRQMKSNVIAARITKMNRRQRANQAQQPNVAVAAAAAAAAAAADAGRLSQQIAYLQLSCHIKSSQDVARQRLVVIRVAGSWRCRSGGE
jgi:hypothetical protein